MSDTYTFIKGKSPIVATAIHEGHLTRQELTNLFNLSEEERLREEDPYTAKWLNISDNNIIVYHSRFETDVNRPRNKAVYQQPEDAWGLKVWKSDLKKDMIDISLAVYDRFYKKVKEYFDSLFEIHENILVYDIHSYNHRREGKKIEADPEQNPEVNIGTQNMDRNIWQRVVSLILQTFKDFDYGGRHLDVRENVKFKGGYFGQWLFEQYGKKICPISIEFKKFFMDEWTGKPFPKDIELINQLVLSSKQPVLSALKYQIPE